MDTSSSEIRDAITELLKKLKDALQHRSGAAPAVSKEEDAVADLSDPNNEGQLICILRVDEKPRVAMLVSAKSSTDEREVKQVTDWRGQKQDVYLMKLINKEWSSEKEAEEALWEAGGVRDPHKPLLVDLFLEAVKYDENDEWKLVQTRFDLDYINATVSGSTAAVLLCSDLGNSKASFKYTLDGVDAGLLRSTVGDNVTLCMTPEDAAAFRTFCSDSGRLLPPCESEGTPVRFFGPTRKSIPDGVTRRFLESRDDLFVRIVGYGMNMKLDMRGLTALKKLRDGLGECKRWTWPEEGDDAWSGARIENWKKAMWKPMLFDFSWVTPMDGVGEGGGETRVVRLTKKKGEAGHNGFVSDVYPISVWGDGRKSGTVTLRRVVRSS